MRSALTDLYGVDKPLPEQYAQLPASLRSRATSARRCSPSPRRRMTLVMRALPWTVVPPDHLDPGHLVTWATSSADWRATSRTTGCSRCSAWAPSAFSRSRTTSSPSSCCIFFGFVWPILPISGAYAMDVEPGWNLDFILSVAAACDPAGHVADPRRIRHLVPRHAGAGLEHRHRGLRDLCRACRRAAQTRGLLLRDAQCRGAAVDRPGPGAGRRSSPARSSPNRSTPIPAWARCWSMRSIEGDSTTVLAVSTVSIIAVAVAIFIVDLLHPLLDPRVRTA